MQVVETAQGNWSNYGLEIVDFWTDGTDFYFSAGKAPSDPPDLFPNIAVLYSDVVLYTQQPPVAAEPTTWGRIKRLR